MRKKNKTVLTIISVVALLIALNFIVPNGLFSLLGEAPGCDITVAGSSCNVDGVLPANREYSTYAPLISFEGTPEDNFKGDTVMTNLGTSQTIRDGTSTYTHYLYKTPSQWKNIYQVEMTTSAFASVNGDFSRVTLENHYFNGRNSGLKTYAQNVVIKCTAPKISGCQDDAVLQQVDSSNGRLLNTEKVGDVSLFDFGRTPGSDTLSVTSILPVSLYENVNPQDVALFSVIQVKQDGGVASNSQPNVILRYKQFVYPRNVQYGINDRFFDTLNGEQTEQVQMLDLANVINEECGRPQNTDACAFSLSFKSDTVGRINIDDEISTERLVEIQEIPNDQQPSGNAITGFSVRSLVDEPIEQVIALILIGVTFIAGIVFIPWGKKK